MPFETTILFRDMDASPALRADILAHARKLERFSPRILACHIAVEHAERHHHQGNRFVVRARLTLPGAELTAGQTPTPNEAHEDPHRAVIDAFDSLRRQLQDFTHTQRSHATSLKRVR